MFKLSWKTTVFGGIPLILTGLGGIISSGGDITLESITAIFTGIGLILGKDFNVSGGK